MLKWVRSGDIIEFKQVIFVVSDAEKCSFGWGPFSNVLLSGDHPNRFGCEI